jgi:photosystem II stability/assembly factor-like uncharacterized protein
MSVTMPTNKDAWAVTTRGEIYASVDGGRTWWPQRSTGREYFRHIFFRGTNRGWAVGDDGKMRRTTDGGATWAAVATGTTARLYDVFFSSPTHGWAVGGSSTILESTDAGATWTPRSYPAAVGAITAVHFVDDRRGWVADNGWGISRTVDGGAHWTRVVMSTFFTARDLDFVSAQRGWAAGTNGDVYVTTDGGVTWTRRSTNGGDHLATVDFSDALNGWVCEDYGQPWYTTDGGLHWHEVATGGATYRALAMPDGVRGCIVGRNTAWTTNGGSTWVRGDRDATQGNLWNVSFTADSRHGWAVGEDGVIVGTHDGGLTWGAEPSPLGADANHTDVAAVSGQRAFAVGTDWLDPDDAGYVLSTTDGGATWTRRYRYPDSLVECVDFIDGQNGWIGGTSSLLLKTTDAGVHWDRVTISGSSPMFRDLDFVSTTRGWASDGYAIRRTTDGGVHWTSQTVPVNGTLHISFVDASNGWAIHHANGAIMHTSDGGATWRQQRAAGAGSRWDIVAASAQRAWAVSEDGVILRTVNGGSTWVSQNSHTGENLLAATMAGGCTWVVGDSGTILSRGYAPAPRLVRRAPSPVRVGKWLTLYGWGFGSSRASTSYVKIGGKKVPAYKFWHDLRIKVRVPKVAAGKRSIKVVVNGVAANTLTVRVKP